MVSKVFEKLVNNKIVDHLEKCGLFSNFQCGFRSSRSSADLLTVVSGRIARTFNRPGATRAVCGTWYIQGFWQGLAYRSSSQTYVYGISSQIFGLVSSFLSNRRLQVVLDGKSSLFLLYINDLPDDVICNIAIYADDTTLYSK